MSRIPLSDESDVELDDETITDDVGTTGPEEQYAELDFDHETDRRYELDLDDLWGDAFEEYPPHEGDDGIEPDSVTGRVK
jgi:hypothetical protein